MSNIKCVRLVAGEEVIGEVTDLNDAVTIKNPAAIHLVPRQDGQVGIGLHPWLPYSEDESFLISKDKVVTTHNPSIELINNYNRLYGSGIQIASAETLTHL